MGAIIDSIDSELPWYSRRVESPRDSSVFVPWQTLGLGATCDTYMNEVFVRAKNKGTEFVDTYQRMKDEYTSQAAKAKAKDDPNKTLVFFLEVRIVRHCQGNMSYYTTTKARYTHSSAV